MVRFGRTGPVEMTKSHEDMCKEELIVGFQQILLIPKDGKSLGTAQVLKNISLNSQVSYILLSQIHDP